MSDTETPLTTVRTVIADRYRIGEQIGKGGRSVVFAAEDVLLQRQVAVKIFRSGTGLSADLKLQEAEARLIAGMNHYALTTLFDAGVDEIDQSGQRIYLVMERIPGLDLRRHLVEYGPMTAAQVAYLGFDLAEGLQYVHEHGFLHRDIKPANVLIAERHATTRVRGKLADFGIATLIGLPDAGEYTTGTAAYLSPEQVEGLDATTASDVYALGLVLLEALTGRVAYPGGVRESAFARLERDPAVPRSIPEALASILRRMTSLLPEDRPDLTEIATQFQKAFVQDLVDAGRVAPTSLPSNEDERLAAVRRYNILDTSTDEAFDRVARLACRMLDVPVALVSIIDADREWFKARLGIAITEIDRDAALCAHTAATGLPFAIPDLRADPAIVENPIVRADPELRSFASAPLTTHEGLVIGTLCVFSRTMRDFTPEDLDALTDLATVAMRELDFRLASRRALLDR